MSQHPSGTVTFLFTDIEGSTRLAQAHREQWEALRGRHGAVLREAMQAHDGYIFEVVGDAFCAAFHTGIDALRAAIDAQRVLQAEAWDPAPIRVRMGLLTGTAHPTSEGLYRGYTSLARAQRLMSCAHGGQVLVSLPTEQLVRAELPPDLFLRDMGERRLKDLVLPERIFQVVAPDIQSDFPPIRTLDAYRHNLPMQMTSFIGRQQDLAEVGKAVRSHRLVTLTGPAGSGKTRLALQVSADLLDDFADGAWFVTLETLRDPEQISVTIASVLGLREEHRRSTPALLQDHLREKTMLLLLDNCEHLVGACAELVGALLEKAPRLKVLATSRQALGVSGEAAWPLHSLSFPADWDLPADELLHRYESIQLFKERATLVQPHFVLDEANAPAIAQICARLDGSPLAIELAAARVRAFSPGQIESRLDDRFNLLTGGSRSAMPRHQTLRAAIDWSYSLLSSAEQDLLQRLSVFEGGWSLEAAEAMAARGEPVLDGPLELLSSLVDKSLVTHDHQHERYSLLESIKQYAQHELAVAGRIQSRLALHHEYFSELVEQMQRQRSMNAQRAGWPRPLQPEVDNLRLALREWINNGEAERAQRMAGALGLFWGENTTWAEGLDWLLRAQSLTGASSPVARGRTLLGLGMVHWARGDLGTAKQNALEGLAIHRELGDGLNIARCLNIAALATTGTGEWEEAGRHLQELLTLARQAADAEMIQRGAGTLGYLRHQEGDYAAAEQLYRESLALAQETGEERGEAMETSNLAILAFDRRNWVEARKLHQKAVALWRRIGAPWWLAMSLSGFADLLMEEGQAISSAKLQGFVQARCEEIGAKLQRLELRAFEKTAAALRRELGEDVYERCLQEGRKLTQEQAIGLTEEQD